MKSESFSHHSPLALTAAFLAKKVEPWLVSWHRSAVSANDIIAELPKLKREELERVDARVHELLQPLKSAATPSQKTIAEILLEFAGTAQGLPEDYSTNLDHYLHGLPKRQP